MCLTHILLVDDEEDVTRILAKRLEKRGYACARAANGREALDAMEGEFFPIVIMDVKMPVLDGMGALQQMTTRWPKGADHPAFGSRRHAIGSASHEPGGFRLFDEAGGL